MTDSTMAPAAETAGAGSRSAEHGSPVAGAIVLGGDFQGLGIVRSLGRRGIPVRVVDDERSISRFSRYASRGRLRADLADGDDLCRVLFDLAGREQGVRGSLLLPTRDETVALLSQRRRELAEVFRVSTPAWETVQIAWDKRLTYTTAERLGIPTPRTWYLSSPEDVRDVDGPPPWAVKPAVKERFIAQTRAKAWRADDRAQLESLVRRAADIVPADEVMVQELVPGDGRNQFAYCALLDAGRPKAWMTVRRLRQHPAEFGRASTYVRVDELPTVKALAERLLEAIGHHGLVEVEFKHDTRDGRTKLLDINARTWGYHSLGAAAGVDFPYLLWRQEVGLPVPQTQARTGTSWVRLLTDTPGAAVGIARGTLGLRDYVRSVLAASTEPVFARDDPLPALAELALTPYLVARRGF